MQGVVCLCEAFLLFPKSVHEEETQGRHLHFARDGEVLDHRTFNQVGQGQSA